MWLLSSVIIKSSNWKPPLSVYSRKMTMTHGKFLFQNTYSKKPNWDYGIHTLFVTLYEKICSSLSFWTKWRVSVSIVWRYKGAPSLQWWCLGWVGRFYVLLSELGWLGTQSFAAMFAFSSLFATSSIFHAATLGGFHLYLFELKMRKYGRQIFLLR